MKMVRGIIAKLMNSIDDVDVVPNDIVTMLEDLLSIAKVEMIDCGVHQMRENLSMALMILQWKAERLKLIFTKKNSEEKLKENISLLLSHYIDVEFSGLIDEKHELIEIAERISKMIDCHVTKDRKIVEMFMRCEHIKHHQQLDLHMHLICKLFKNHIYLGKRRSQKSVTSEELLEVYWIWYRCSKDMEERAQLGLILNANTRPPTKTKRSFFSIGEYFDSDDSSEGDYSDEGRGSCCS